MNLKETLKVLMQKDIVYGVKYTDRVSWSFTNEENQLSFIEKVHFKNCTFEEDFRMANLQDENLPLRFEKCIFKKAFLINLSKFFSLEIDECTIAGEATLIGSEIEEIDIKESNFSSYLLLSDIKSDSCSILGSEKTKIEQIFLASRAVDTFILESKKGVNNLCLRSANRVEIGGELNQLEIDANEFNNITYTNEVSSERLKLNELIIQDLYFSGNILFQQIDIKNLNMSNVTCTDGSVRFNELNVKSADFENVNIESFFWNQITFEKELVIERCNFNALMYSNITWLKDKRVSDSYLHESIPIFYTLRKKYLNDSYYDSTDLIQLRYERETYKQLKAAAISNHLHIEALDFYRNEMRVYWKEVRIAGNIPIQNRILVFLNRWSSDFGQNWLLPIIWLFAFHLLWFCCLINWSFYSNPWNGSQEFAQYFKLLNPTHELPKYVSTGTGYLSDIIMRVSIGYFVYHIIKATRKYGKI